jgi:hypothetical protein
MLYLETRWASLIPFEKVVDWWKEVLPVAEATNAQTVREDLYAVAERIEPELGEERPPGDFATLEAIAELPLPDGPMTVGIDGGYVRAAHQQGNFEVIAGRRAVELRRAEGDSVPPPKCFGLVPNLRPETAATGVGGEEVARDAGEPAGSVQVRRWRRGAAGAGRSASEP